MSTRHNSLIKKLDALSMDTRDELASRFGLDAHVRPRRLSSGDMVARARDAGVLQVFSLALKVSQVAVAN